MKIKTSSFHYRLLNYLYDDVPEGLCTYFWKMIFSLIWVVFTHPAYTFYRYFTHDEKASLPKFLISCAVVGFCSVIFIYTWVTDNLGIGLLLEIETDHYLVNGIPSSHTEYIYLDDNESYFWVVLAFIAVFGAHTAWVFLASFLAIIHLVDLLIEKKPPKETKNIISAYIRAKKNKVCPRLEFEEP